jgi:hypothetical protein
MARRVEWLAASLLALAAVVIIVSPSIVGDPNVLALPAAIVTGLGTLGALRGATGGQRLAVVVGLCGLVLSILWLALASSGFGKGTAWSDDMIEAAVLAGLFGAAVACLAFARRSRVRRGLDVPNGVA